MNSIKSFTTQPFISALKSLFEELNVPINYLSEKPFAINDILGYHYKTDNKVHQLIKDIYVLGTISDKAFNNNETLSEDEVKNADYDFIMVMGIVLKENKIPNRSELAELTRLANKAFNTNEKGNPVTVVFQYGNLISLANTERQDRKDSDWREGEKLGKVTLLRDIDCEKTHAGHIRILQELKINRTGNKAIEGYKELYDYWHSVLNTSILNKKFYKELSDWYFWAISEVTFPSEPIRLEFDKEEKYTEAIKEHRAKNVIRLLTRILFIWFIKEKGLIPEELFDEKSIADQYLDEFEPQKDHGLFAVGKHKSRYYRAILQNLFFATLNQPVGERKFRKDKDHMNVNQLMRYKSYLKNPDDFVKLMEATVPFMNGGLFECLDKPHETLKSKQGGDRIVYIDGFSDRDDNPLNVPDFLFFDVEEEVDLSNDYGDKKHKKSKTKGLMPLLKSYKFTITENTPIEEDVALDPELLGKVFENLLASYNPETKTTARKQTGSFYTPREIVSYMVDESLIAYLKNELTHEEAGVVELGKNQISLFGNETKSGQLSLEVKLDESPFKDKEEQLDNMLHQLVAYSNDNPFETYKDVNKKIIKALDTCKILDPACGSGAFPMGILQKMVHILHKIDPDNKEWKERQILRVDNAIAELEKIDDSKYRDQTIVELEAQKKDIEEAFANNELDYGRKLFLIENCIFGVDIQPIATQISKLRFFISLVVDQKVDKTKENFGIRPLPNLETKFVAANTLIGIDKPKERQGDLFEKPEIRKLEKDLQKVRQKLFSSKSPSRKRELREQDKTLREAMSELLTEEYGHDTAKKLAAWDPYDQNASSPFFDPEWMFDIKHGFDVVIGNPPYHQLSKDTTAKKDYKDYLKSKYKTSAGRLNLFIFFTHEAILLSKKNSGIVSFIIPNTLLTQEYYTNTRKKILDETSLIKLVNYDQMPFENAVVENITFVLKNSNIENNIIHVTKNNLREDFHSVNVEQQIFLTQKNFVFNFNSNDLIDEITSNKQNRKLSSLCDINQGIALKGDKSLSLRKENSNNNYYRLLDGRNINKYKIEWDGVFLDYNLERIHSCKRKDIFESEEKLLFRRVSKNLIFAYDQHRYFALNTLVIVNKKQSCLNNLKSILAILNSDLLNYVYLNKFKSTKKVFSEIQARSVKELPIPVIDKKFDNMLNLISSILVFKNNFEGIFSMISNGVVYNLYFPDHMQERGIDVQTYIESDIEKVMQGRDFETMSDDDKNDVINKLHTTWTDPNNEVVKRMAMFKEKSPDVLKVIMEG